MSFEAVADAVRGASRILVSCHRRPDADALGSALAFARSVRELGKTTVVYVPEAVPKNLRYLPEDGELLSELPEGEFDLTVVMDTAAESLLPRGIPTTGAGPLVIVDHHAAHDDVGDLVLRDIEACSTGEVIHRLLASLGAPVANPAIAQPLYAAVVADTGGFRYPGTTGDTLRLGGELLDAGADAWEAASHLFERWAPARLKLLGAIIESLRTSLDGRLAVLEVTRETLDRLGANDDMVEGMVNYGRMLDGVEVALLLWEWPTDNGIETKVSLRSRGQVDVAAVASAIGGGGHAGAAGAQVAKAFDEVERLVTSEVERLLP